MGFDLARGPAPDSPPAGDSGPDLGWLRRRVVEIALGDPARQAALAADLVSRLRALGVDAGAASGFGAGLAASLAGLAPSFSSEAGARYLSSRALPVERFARALLARLARSPEFVAAAGRPEPLAYAGVDGLAVGRFFGAGGLFACTLDYGSGVACFQVTENPFQPYLDGRPMAPAPVRSFRREDWPSAAAGAVDSMLGEAEALVLEFVRRPAFEDEPDSPAPPRARMS